MSNSNQINEGIRASELRVIDSNGAQLGIISKSEAVSRAREQDLDLVVVSEGSKPPVAKIIDWGKFNYQKEKQAQKNKRNTKVSDLKQMRFGLKIGEHDIDVKLGKVTKFLDDGHKVRLTIVLRGRELAHKDLAFKLAEKLIAKLGENIAIDQEAQFAGKQLNMVVRRSSNAKN